MKKIVIIGGCAAGPKVAAKCKRLLPDSKIQLYTEEDIVSYSACGLPYYIEGIIENIEELIIRTPDEFEKNGVEIYLNSRCTEIIKEKNIAVIGGKEIFYDELVIATGARANISKIKNTNLKGVYTLKHIKDGIDIKNQMKNSRKMIIIGGGYIALELLEAFRANNLEVLLIESKNNLLGKFDKEFSDGVENYILKRDGNYIQFLKGKTVNEILGKGSFKGVKLTTGEEILADFCVIATGVMPNTELAQNAGIKIGKTGAIKVNNRMKTSYPNIWAVGDCAEKHCLITKIPVYAPSGSIANKEGRVCAINIAGGEENFRGVLCSSVTRYFDYTLSTTGLTEKKANEYANLVDIEPVCANVVKVDKAGYMPKTNEIMVKMVADKRTGEILGAQAAGLGDADKRINIIAASINSGLTIQDFINLDLTYAPPFATPIDSLLEAAYRIKKEMKKN